MAQVAHSGQVAKCIATAVWAVVAVVTVVFDRRTFAGGPRSFLEEPPSLMSEVTG